MSIQSCGSSKWGLADGLCYVRIGLAEGVTVGDASATEFGIARLLAFWRECVSGRAIGGTAGDIGQCC